MTDELQRRHRRYLDMLVRRESREVFVTSLLFGLLFATLGSLGGDAVSDHDWWRVVVAGVAGAALLVLYWMTVLRRR